VLGVEVHQHQPRRWVADEEQRVLIVVEVLARRGRQLLGLVHLASGEKLLDIGAHGLPEGFE
jgi:hypothetical protein